MQNEESKPSSIEPLLPSCGQRASYRNPGRWKLGIGSIEKSPAASHGVIQASVAH
jgi:hypothetical protein